MCDGKRSCLLRKRQRKFPDQNDSRIYKKGKRAVLKFSGKIAANPRIRTQDRPVSLRPAARHIGEHRQDRQFVVVIPKNERIVPEQNEAEEDDNESGGCRAKNVRTRGLRLGHLTRQTPNAQRPTPNAQGEKKTLNAQRPTLNAQRKNAWSQFESFSEFFSAVRTLVKKLLISSSVSPRMAPIFSSGTSPAFCRNRSQRLVSLSSFKQIRSLWTKSRRDSA